MPSQRRMEAYFLGLPTPERDTKPAGSASRCITRRLYGMPLPNQEEASKKEGQSLRSGGFGSRKGQTGKDHERPGPVLLTPCRPL